MHWIWRNLTGRSHIVGPISALFFFSAPLSGADVTFVERLEASRLEIRNYPVEAPNNWGETYSFTVSVLGLVEGQDFLPLLAIAGENADGQEARWLALWHLSGEPPGWPARLKALVPAPWSPRSGGQAEFDDADILPPEPYLTARDRKQGARSRFLWTAARRVSGWLQVLNPLRFTFHSYVHFRNDFEDRRFERVYTLLCLYGEVAALNPDPGNFSPLELADLKYQLLLNRKPLGVLAESESSYEAVAHFEGRRRTQMGQAASFFHSRANLYHLRFQEVSYGFPERPPVTLAGVLSIRMADLPERLPPWPARNPFDLAYNPYAHHEIRRLMKAFPQEEIPLAFYVLASDFQLRPVIVADFFAPGNPRARESTASLRMALEHFLSIHRVPLLYRTLKRVGAYTLKKPDYTHFSDRSWASGVESAGVFAGLQWKFEETTNEALLEALESRVANPLAESFGLQRANSRLHSAWLFDSNPGQLALALRRLFEDEVRAELELGNRAIFAEDFERFEDRRVFLSALQLIREFNRQEHLTGFDWGDLLEAYGVLARRDPEGVLPESRRFLERLDALYPGAVPASHRLEAVRVLFPIRPQVQVLEGEGRRHP